MKTFLSLMCLLSLLVIAPVASAQDACPDSLPPRLVVGELGRVTPGDPNNVRAEPARSATLIGGIAGGGFFSVLDGPTCADGLTWWQVQYESENGKVTGWTVEGSGDTYFVEPVTGVLVQIEGLSIVVPEAIADGAEGSFVEAVVPTEAKPYDDYPGYYLFGSFENYPDDDHRDYDVAQIRIYRVEDMEKERGDSPYYGSAQVAIEGLRENLENRPNLYLYNVTDARFPDFAPMVANVLLAQMAYLDFQNGSGYRLITGYAQDFFGVTNEMLLYRYLGLTNDGVYFVEADFPIDSPKLPPDFDREATADDADYGFDSFKEYTIESAAFFDAIPPEEFTPDLTQLDALIASLTMH